MYKNRFRKDVFLYLMPLLVLPILLFITVSDVSAVASSRELHTLAQPDGFTFQARQWGDEYSHGMETEEGYTIIFDDTLRSWTYAVSDDEGNLIASTYIVGKVAPPAGLEKHLRPTGNALLRIQQKHRRIQPLSLDEAVTREPMTPKTGTNNILVVLVSFSDTSPNFTASQYEDLYFKKDNNSLKDYYLENSYGKLTVTSGPNGIQGWWKAANTHNYYGADDPNEPNNLDVKLPEAILDAVKALDNANFDFTKYSLSGDCYVDMLAIIAQGRPQSSTSIKTDIWPVQGELQLEYTTKAICSAGGNIKIKKYTVQTEQEGDGKMATIGVFAHEYGHALGLPDLYDTADKSQGAGDWAVMARGNYNKAVGGRSGDRPAHHDAWSKYYLGWTTPAQVISTLTNITIPPAEDASTVYKLLSGTPNSKEYFLIENRQQKKFDAGLSGPGLLIWRIDGDIVANIWEAGQNTVNAKPCNNGILCSVQHYGVALQQADGAWDLEKNLNTGDAGDPFPGNAKNTSFTDTSTPDSKLYNGSGSNVSVTGITVSGENVIATIKGPAKSMFFTPSTSTFTKSKGIQSFTISGASAGAAFTWSLVTTAGAAITDTEKYGTLGGSTTATETITPADVNQNMSFKWKAVTNDPALIAAGLDTAYSDIMRIVREASYTVTVLDTNSNPINGTVHTISVKLNLDASSNINASGQAAFSLTDTGGTNTFTVVDIDASPTYVGKMVTSTSKAVTITLAKQTAMIQGKVYDTSGNVIGGVDLAAFQPDNPSVAYEATSESKTGAYVIYFPSGVPATNWTIATSKDDYVNGYITGVALNSTNADFTGANALQKQTIISITSTIAGAANTTVSIQATPSFNGSANEIAVTKLPGKGSGTISAPKYSTDGWTGGTWTVVYNALDDFSIQIMADTVKATRDVSSGYYATTVYSYQSASPSKGSASVNVNIGGAQTSLKSSGQTADIIVPAGGVTASGIITITQIQKTTTTAVATNGSPLYLYDVSVVDTSGNAFSADKIKRIIIKLPIDLSVVNPGDFEAGIFVIYHASSRTALEAGNCVAIPVSQILISDYVGDGKVGSVTFWTSSLSVFGIGSGGGGTSLTGGGG
ncbi:MAG TPA: M6 family metalloprotease domain-containing protein, partial [Desulfuromonadaceae bacterium]